MYSIDELSVGMFIPWSETPGKDGLHPDVTRYAASEVIPLHQRNQFFSLITGMQPTANISMSFNNIALELDDETVGGIWHAGTTVILSRGEGTAIGVHKTELYFCLVVFVQVGT